MQINELIETIVMGDADAHLDALFSAIKERKAILTQTKASFLKVTLGEGARVKFVDSVRPKYLAGVGATVKKVNQKKVLVKVDEGFGGAYMGKTINCPLTLIEAV